MSARRQAHHRLVHCSSPLRACKNMYAVESLSIVAGPSAASSAALTRPTTAVSTTDMASELSRLVSVGTKKRTSSPELVAAGSIGHSSATGSPLRVEATFGVQSASASAARSGGARRSTGGRTAWCCGAVRRGGSTCAVSNGNTQQPTAPSAMVPARSSRSCEEKTYGTHSRSISPKKGGCLRCLPLRAVARCLLSGLGVRSVTRRGP